MTRTKPLFALRDVAALFHGDLYALAVFLLKAYDARDREANARNPRVGIKPSRPTLHGLASRYPHVTGVAVRCVEGELAKACSALG